jgi:tetratricopeptide (TPR) repeat protein
LIAARVDGLAGLERKVIERAAIAGALFYQAAVSELSPEEERSTVGSSLMALVRKQLIRPERAEFAGQIGFRFRHVLIRDTAYDAMPKEMRAELHERFAGWFETLTGDRAIEYEEILGYHLEQAHDYLVELGRHDDLVAHLGRRAAERLSGAARRALLRGDASAAAQLLAGIDDLIDHDELWREAGLTRAAAVAALGDLPAATDIYERVRVSAEAQADRRTESRALLGIAGAGVMMGRDGAAKHARSVVERAVPWLEEAGDDAGLAQAWNVMADIGNNEQSMTEMASAAEKALFHARQAGDAWAEAESINQLGIALMFGPDPSDQILSRLDTLLEEVSDVRARGCILGVQGYAFAMVGDFERARRLMTEGQAMLIDRGYVLDAHGFDLASATIELKAGNPAGAEAILKRACVIFEQRDALAYLSTGAASLAEALYRQGRIEEAVHWTHVSATTTADDDMVSQMAFRCVRSKILAQKGDTGAATALAEEVLVLASRTPEAAMLRADSLSDVAETFAITGASDRAIPLWRTALAQYERKKDLPAVQLTQRRLAEAEGAIDG